MLTSTLTAKGQTTIPREVREWLHLGPNDKIIYVPDGDRIFLKPVKGTILDLKGILRKRSKGPVDYEKVRNTVKRKIALQIREEKK